MTVGFARRGGWQPFPERPALADRLHAIRADTPPSLVVEILTAGRPDGGSPGAGVGGESAEADRPPTGSLSERVSEGFRLGAGRLLNWLGRTLGRSKWAEAGADLARRAIERVPRLGEKVLGAQEAALRELLRQLQSGDVERALRRAPIAVADPDAPPARLDGGSRLTDHDTRYSLRDLLTSGRSGGAAWLGGGNVWNLLAAEYRRLAEEAVRRGDFRRAAYLYGVLLRDPRQAARVLDAGGLHRDAAVLYRDKLGDLTAAAGCFERAGCWDEAVALYQRLEQYEKAGDVFRRIGEESAALDMYRRAAAELAGRGRFRDAGDLVRRKAGLEDEARQFYRAGWGSPLSADVLPCGLKLVDDRLRAEDWGGLHKLLAEAEEKFAPPRADDAGRFFGTVAAAAVGEGPVPEVVRADLRDRCRVALAEHLRHHARTGRQPGPVASTLFGGHPAWPGPVVRDAREALRRATRPAAGPSSLEALQLLPGPVTAAAVARESGDLVLANAAGRIVLYRGGDEGTVTVAWGNQALPSALALDGTARQVVAMIASPPAVWLESFVARGETGYEALTQLAVGDFPDGLPYLQPEIEPDAREVRVRLLGPEADREYRGPGLLPIRTAGYPAGTSTTTLSVLANPGRWWWVGDLIRLEFGGLPVGRRQPSDLVLGTARMPWRPAVPAGSSLVFPPVDWLTPQPQVLEVAGVSGDGAVYWSEVRRFGDTLTVATAAAEKSPGYRAACLIGPGLLAAATADNQLHWLRADGSPSLRRRAAPRNLPHPLAPVFLAHRPRANEVVVVFSDGWAVRVPKP